MIKDKKALTLFISLLAVMAVGVLNVAAVVVAIMSLIVNGNGWGMLFSFIVNLVIVAIAYAAIKVAAADHLDKVNGKDAYKASSRNLNSMIQH